MSLGSHVGLRWTTRAASWARAAILAGRVADDGSLRTTLVLSEGVSERRSLLRDAVLMSDGTCSAITARAQSVALTGDHTRRMAAGRYDTTTTTTTRRK